MTTEHPDPIDHGHVTLDFGDRPFVRVVVPLTGSPAEGPALIKGAIRSVLASLDVPAEDVEAFKTLMRDSILGKRAPQPPPQQNQGGGQRRGGGGQRPQQRRGGGGRGQSRSDRFQLYEGERCDICNGPVGIYPRTGNMQSDKLVCLGTCKDGEYVHTVRWLDDDELPF